ncbi:carbohydrate-binding protein [Chitinibacter sp. ZOR0017]|uniref:carbohydrate-binding protein n=1 Tax=Chitinibacter sp. ZOR0017 TaxID=1339254 RepID=UPI000A98603D|nr:carbohydrate-binding protein [Chitinibacter sp. ZOR0017]
MQAKNMGHALVFALLTSAGLVLNPAQATTPTPSPTATPSYPSWDSAAVYNGGQRVIYNSQIYEARWWTQGNNPAEAGEWGPWKLIGAGPTPTPSPTPSSNVVTLTASQVPNGVKPCGSANYANWQSNQNYASGAIVAVSSTSVPFLVFTAQQAHLSTAANQPRDNGNGTISYDRTVWAPSNALPAPCPSLTPSPTPSTPPVNQAPTISLDTAASVSCQAPFLLKANASDSDGLVSKVEFFVDNNLVGSKTNAPYELTVSNTNGCSAIGSKKAIYAVATDNLGLQTRSATINVTIVSDIVPTPNPTPIATYANWNATTAYTSGQRVSYNGRAFEAKWWTQGQTPNANDQWGPWKDLGVIGNATPSPTPVITATPTPTVSASPSPTPSATPTATPSTTPAGNLSLTTAAITTWKNGAKGAYSLVHDDYCSMYYGTDPYIKIMDPELKKRGLVAGFGMITGSCSEQHWAAAKTFIANGHEIVSHSRNHPNPYIPDASLETEINGATADIAAKLDGYQASYFIWPGDVASTKAVDFLKAQPNFIGGRATHLVDGSGPNNAVDYTTMPAGVNPANFDNPYRVKWDLFTTDGKWSLYPMGSEILNLHIDAAISQGGWATRTAHGVDTGYWETIPLNRYLAHLDYAKAKVDSGELWMDTPSNVIKYRYAREKCSLIVPTVVGNRSIGFNTSAECQKYATPVTLQLTVANLRGTLQATQGGQALAVKAGPAGSWLVTAHPLAGGITLSDSQ